MAVNNDNEAVEPRESPHSESSGEADGDLHLQNWIGDCTLSEARSILEVNDAFCSLLGVAKDELLQRLFARFIFKEDRDLYELYLNRLFEIGEPQVFNLRLIKSDETFFWAQFACRLTQDSAGARVISVILSDVTGPKRVEMALLQNEKMYRDLVETSHDLIWSVDIDGRWTFVNRLGARSLYGYEPEEMLGRQFVEFQKAEQSEKDLEVFARIKAGEPVYHYETEHLRKDGSAVILSYNAIPLFDLAGQLIGTTGTARDITERKNLEGQLQQAQKMESVGRLAGGVAHDFNNMLTVILGNLEMAIGQLTPEDPIFASLKEVRSAAERSADLTRQLLAFARKQIVSPKVLNLNEAVEGMLMLLQRLIGENISIRWEGEINLSLIRMDPTQVNQILTNLCVNARDAIAGVGTISIETGNQTLDQSFCLSREDLVPGDYVRLTVRDEGCGMDAETLQHLFEPFFTTKEIGEGTGLGLSTVYGIVKQNQGMIEVSSEVGKGTTFHIYLPQYLGEEAPVLIEEAAKTLRGNETLLLVEDEPALLLMTTRMLVSQGYTVLAAATPQEAIFLAQQNAAQISLLVTDVVMPEMNGPDLANNLKSLYPHFPCLFMSGYTEDDFALHCDLEEGVHFIEKPFSIKALSAKVRKVLDEKREEFE